MGLHSIYNSSGDIIEVKIKNGTGQRMDKRVANLADQESVRKILNHVIDKYGMNFKIVPLAVKEINIWKADEEFKW